EEDQRAARETGRVAARVGRAVEDAAGRTATNQRRAAGKGRVARTAESRGRGQEPRGRRGPLGNGREGRATRAYFQVQVRVSGQHVARTAYAAQQHVDPVATAGRE